MSTQSKASRLTTLALAAILVAVLVWLVTTNVISRGEQDERARRIDTLSTQVDQLQASTTKARNEQVSTALGVTPSRVLKDTATLTTLTDITLTWDSGATYTSARETLTRRFKVKADGEFLTGFMPPARFNTDRLGTRHDYIDTVGINSAVEADPKVKVVGVRGSNYSYAVIADVVFTSDAVRQGEKRISSTRTVLLEASVDADGQVTTLRGHMASGDALISD